MLIFVDLIDFEFLHTDFQFVTLNKYFRFVFA